MTLHRLDLPEPLMTLLRFCESSCVAGCCGLDAFEFTRERFDEWFAAHPKEADKVRSQIRALQDELVRRAPLEVVSDELQLNAVWSGPEATEFLKRIALLADPDPALSRKDAELSRLLTLSAKAYAFLVWLDNEVNKGRLRADSARDALSMADSTRGWIERSLEKTPEHCRPEPADLPAFTHLVGSHLVTSFDWVADPGEFTPPKKGFSWIRSNYVLPLSHFRPKTLKDQDRRRAWELQVAALIRHAGRLGKSVSRDDAILMMGKDALREPMAVLAYVDDLRERIQGRYEGPAALALWRQFAWMESGPKKNFAFTADLVLDAERRLANVLRRSGEPDRPGAG